MDEQAVEEQAVDEQVQGSTGDAEALEHPASPAEAGTHTTTIDGSRAEITLDELDWWRRPGLVGEHIWVSGDLPSDSDRALAQLRVWQDLGITVIVDCREEYSDEELVAEHAPGIVYVYAGTHDAGGVQDPAWFERTVDEIRTARSATGGGVMVHCHMGVNRGPSMAFAALLDLGWDPLDALDALLEARPVAAVAYAESALRWHHGRLGSAAGVLDADLRRVVEFLDGRGVDAARSIGRIRRSQ